MNKLLALLLLSCFFSIKVFGQNVGVGTTNPAEKLDVSGTTQSLGFKSATDGTTTIPAYNFSSQTNMGMYRAGSNNIGFSINGIRFSVQSSQIRSYQVMRNIDGTATAPAYSFTNSSTAGMYRGGADILRFSTTSTDRMTIDAAGLVGIGTTAPAERLQVAGNVKADMFLADGNRYNILSYNANTTPSNGYKITTAIPFTNSSQMPAIFIEGYNYGNGQPIGLMLVWYIYNGSFVNYKISSYGAYAPAVQLSNENGYVVIFINDQRYYMRFTVRAFAKGMGETDSWFKGWSVADAALAGTNTVTLPYENRFDGNVFMPGSGIWNTTGIGVGTNSPTQALDVNGSIRVRSGAGTIGNVLKSTSTDGTVGWGQVAYSELSGVPSELWIQSGNNIYNANSGNVGVGTSSPGEKFQVAGNIQANSAFIGVGGHGSTYLHVSHSNYKAAGQYALLQDGSGGNTFLNSVSSGNIYFRNNNSDRMILTSAGNLGIGTTSPSQKLTIQGTGGIFGVDNSSTFQAKNASGSYETYLWPRWSDNIMYMNYGSSGFHIRNNSSVTTMFMTNGNYVGIGTTNPGAPLAVAHEASYSFPNPGSAAKGAINIRMSTSNTQTGITFSQAGSDNAQAGIYVHQDNSAGTHMYLATTNSYAAGPQTRITILNSGNVGIGTTAPSYTLHVNGRIKSNGITESSDVRLKENIETLRDALEKVLQLRGVKYSWKEEAGEDKFKDGTQLGLIAQEVEKILPEVVDTDLEGYKSIQYSVLVALLIEAMKEQQNEISTLENKMDDISKTMAAVVQALEASGIKVDFKAGK